jgi:hypothetical protein
MGLDMYAFSTAKNAENKGSPDSWDEDNEIETKELAYWRKFNALHGWMEDLYHSRGGSETFNCVDLRLYEEDLDELETVLNNNNLIPREGFFFGSMEIYPEDVESTRKFISSARDEIREGREVYYNSWW